MDENYKRHTEKKGKQIEIEWNMSPKNCIKKNSTYKNKRIQPINVEPKYTILKKKRKKITATKKSMPEYSSKCGNWNVNTHVCYSCAICQNWIKKGWRKQREKQQAGTHKNIMHTI